MHRVTSYKLLHSFKKLTSVLIVTMFHYMAVCLYIKCGILVAILFAVFKMGLTTPFVMKAVVIEKFGRSDVLSIQEVPVPVLCKDEILVKVMAAGINSIDVRIRTGSVRTKSKLPFILGKEVSGYVEKVHRNVRTFKVGDRVFCGLTHGGYAEYVATGESYCFQLADRLSFSQGAALFITYFACYKALILKGDTHRDDTVLIHGASGSVGTAAVQVSKQIGAYVIASVGSPFISKLMKQVGADYIVYHNCGDYLTDALNETKKDGFDTILEITGHLNLEHDKQYLTPTGKMLVMGNRAFGDAVDSAVTVIEDPRVIVVSFFGYTKAELKAAGHFILDGIEEGIINPIIAREYTLDEAPRAHYDIFYSKTGRGKFVFVT